MLGTAPVMTKTWRMSWVSMFAGLIVAPAHAFEMVTPFEGDDFGVAF